LTFEDLEETGGSSFKVDEESVTEKGLTVEELIDVQERADR